MRVKISFLGNLSKIFFEHYHYIYLYGEVAVLKNIIEELYEKYPNLKGYNFICCINNNYVTSHDTTVFDNDIITLISPINK